MVPVYVIKIGGRVVDNPAVLLPFLDAFARLEAGRVLVHGGGKSATQLAQRLGVDAPMVEGRRITDDAMLEVALMVYGGLVNRQVVAHLQARQVDALGLAGADLNMVRAHKRPVGKVDYGWAGDVDEIGTPRLLDLLARGIVPVMAPLSHDGKGQMLNTNADTIASMVAKALAPYRPVRLVYVFEKAGVLTDPDDEASLIPLVNRDNFARYKAEGIIAGGMIPKLDNAFAALEAGVEQVYICRPEAMASLDTPDYPGTVVV